MTSESPPPIIKIAVVGLENAGKTSLIRTLHKTYQIGSNLKPTKNVERTAFSLFGRKSSIWDFGAQAPYRKAYLENPNRYLTEIRYLFFVIDIQDHNIFSVSLKYFEELYKLVLERNPQVLISVFFHKVDPDIMENTDIKENIEYLSTKIHELAEDVEIGYYSTSSFDPLSVLNAFSLPILGDQEIYNVLSVLFAEFAMKNSIEYINLLVDDLMECGSFSLKSKEHEFLPASIDFYKNISILEVDSKIRSYLFEGYRFIIVKEKYKSYEFTLNIAHPIETDEKTPSEEEILSLIKKIDEQFKKYNPIFH